MVLTRRAVGVLLLAACVLGAPGCKKRVGPQRLPERAELATALVLDPLAAGEPAEAPLELEKRLAAALDSRNLEVRRRPLAALAGQRLSKEREAALGRAAPQAPFRLLVETRAVFFSQLDGRYRWTVAVRLAAARAGQPDAVVDDFDLPAVLQYDREKEAAAVEAVADEIARRAALLLDGLLASASSAPPAPTPAPTDAGAATARPRSLYFVMVDRFANGDRANDGEVDPNDPAAFHGGDLQGLRARLDWLQDLGVDAVWLSPVFAMRTAKYGEHGAFHGYWVERLDRVEPRFGGEPALRALAEDLRARGMKLVLDVVLNHAAPDGELVRARPEWFHRQGGIQDWSDPLQLVTRDVHGLPDLAQERDDVYRYLLDGTLRWVRALGAYGLRLDAVKHMPLDFWARFARDVRAEAPRAPWLLGELLDGDAPLLARTWTGGGFDTLFDFPLAFALADVFCRGAAPERLAAVLAHDRLYPDPSALVTLLDNHDLPRVASLCGGDGAKVQAALTALFALRGVPSLTWGTEVGLRGEAEPLNRGDMRFEAGPLYAHLRALHRARRAHPALAGGAVEVVRAEGRCLVLRRVAAAEVALLAVNHSAQPCALDDGALGPWRDALAPDAAPEARPQAAPGQVRVLTAQGDFRARHAAADAQWRTGARKREVRFEVPAGARVAGSGPELGAWRPEGAVVAATLPVGAVFELKLVRDRGAGAYAWEAGDNRVLFVAPGEGPLRVDLAWRS